MEEDRRLLSDSRMLERPLIPETKAAILGGNEGLLAALGSELKKKGKEGRGVRTQFRDPALDLRGAQLWDLNGRKAICT